MAHAPDPAPVDRSAPRAGATLPANSRLAGYLIERPIAAAAGSAVYRAIDERGGRRVALKVLAESATPPARERFLRQVRTIAGLQHPNVVLLLGAGEDRGVAWAAMELMPVSLSQELHQRGRFSAADLRAVVRDVCRGLDAASNRGIVHRDLKPSNLMRSDDGTVKIADFGLAKDLSLELNLTAAGVVFGTPWYVSPEQAAGRPGWRSAGSVFAWRQPVPSRRGPSAVRFGERARRDRAACRRAGAAATRRPSCIDDAADRLAARKRSVETAPRLSGGVVGARWR